jgi:peptidoglycan-associated lipoprotein
VVRIVELNARRREEELSMRMTFKAGLVLAALAVAGCAGPAVTVPTVPDAGFSGGFDADVEGTGAETIYAGTLPGTSISDTVLFTVDQSTLNPQAISVLDQQIGWLSSNPGVAVRIEGHADERGTRDYNFQLGSARASAVRNYMVSRGITDGRISVTTYGRERPVAACASESCWAQNRRAVTVVTSGAGA